MEIKNEYTQLEDGADLSGKTIEKNLIVDLDSYSCKETLIIFFTDKTFISYTSEHDYRDEIVTNYYEIGDVIHVGNYLLAHQMGVISDSQKESFDSYLQEKKEKEKQESDAKRAIEKTKKEKRNLLGLAKKYPDILNNKE